MHSTKDIVKNASALRFVTAIFGTRLSRFLKPTTCLLIGSLNHVRLKAISHETTNRNNSIKLERLLNIPIRYCCEIHHILYGGQSSIFDSCGNGNLELVM